MKFGARSARDAIGDRFPLPVQAGLPVSRFAVKTGTNSQSGGASNRLSSPEAGRVLSNIPAKINDCGVTRRASGLGGSQSVPNKPVLPTASFCNGRESVPPQSDPQSPLFVLALMVAPLVVVVTVGLFLTL